MTKRTIGSLAVMLLVMSLIAAPAAAEGHGEFEEHGHMLVLGVEYEVIDGFLFAVDFRKCIDMPVVTNRGHHANVHTGRAGMALEAAGHAFVPSFNFPFTPWESCADLEADLPINLGPA